MRFHLALKEGKNNDVVTKRKKVDRREPSGEGKDRRWPVANDTSHEDPKTEKRADKTR